MPAPSLYHDWMASVLMLQGSGEPFVKTLSFKPVVRGDPSTNTCLLPLFRSRQAVQQHRPKVVFLTSPNNPDGSMLADEDVSTAGVCTSRAHGVTAVVSLTSYQYQTRLSSSSSSSCYCDPSAAQGDPPAAGAGGTG